MKNNKTHNKTNSENKDKSANNKPAAVRKENEKGRISGGSQEKKKYPFWFYSVPILIPVIFFILLETGLRLFHYGKEIETFVAVWQDYPDMLFTNPEVPSRYFPGLKIMPSVVPDGFRKVKSDSTFRVFVLGESSTEGWPYAPNASFPRYLKRKLSLLYPHNSIEVVNMGITAINTFAMRDMLPDILRQKPDLIIFYNGHNEYYGTLGAGSSESIGKSRFLVNFMLELKKFKTFELITNVIRYFTTIIHGTSENKQNNSSETLMARMIGESLIPYSSGTYKAGLSQFEGNMRDMLELTKKAGIPVILGTLTSNLKDQKPFISANEEGLERADKVYDEAREYFSKGNFLKAKELFIKAKELDCLRFRAPEEINRIILKLGQEFNYSVAPVEEDFEKQSPGGITGNNLMADHLHPNIKGYQLMGESFYKTMKKYSLLPHGKQEISEGSADSLLKANFPFTRLDSTVSDLRLRVLLGEYPFVPKGSSNHLLDNLRLNDFVDTLAGMIMDKKIDWESAHLKAAEYYYKKKQFRAFEKEMNAIIEEHPFNETSYGYTAEKLIKASLFREAVPYLKKLQEVAPGAYSTKWLGLLALNGKNYKEAVYYLESSLQYSQDDPQVWYNLAGAYFNLKKTDMAIETLRKCLRISPDFHPARLFYEQLTGAQNRQK